MEQAAVADITSEQLTEQCAKQLYRAARMLLPQRNTLDIRTVMSNRLSLLS